MNRKYNAVGGAEIQGKRPTQEDGLLLMGVDASFFDPKNRKGFNKIAKAVISRAVQQHWHADQGACLLLAGASLLSTTRGNRRINAFTANLGDSVAFLLVCDSKGHLIRKKCFLLNRLHNGYNQAEVKRIYTEGGRIYEGFGILRLEGSLAVTRAVGDVGLPGIGRAPELLKRTVNLKENERVFLLLACDGLFEAVLPLFLDSSTVAGTRRIKKTILDFIEGSSKNSFPPVLQASDFKHFKPQLVSKKLVEAGFQAGSSDNISVLIQEIEWGKQPLLMGIFDGHGGSAVSYALAEQLPKIFAQKIEESGGACQILDAACHVRTDRTLSSVRGLEVPCAVEKGK